MEVGESGIGESGVGVGDGHRKGCLRGWVCGFQEGDELVGEFDELVAVEGRGAGGVVEEDARHDCGGGVVVWPLSSLSLSLPGGG